MCPVTHTYAENGDLTTSREYMEFDTKADLQGVSLIQSYAYDAVGRTTEVTYKQGEAVKRKVHPKLRRAELHHTGQLYGRLWKRRQNPEPNVSI